MAGQLGSNTIAAIGVGCRFPTLFNYTVGGLATCASIMIAQYSGTKDQKGINRSFYANGYFGILLTLLFMVTGILIPDKIVLIFSTDPNVIPLAAKNLRIVSFGKIPIPVIMLLSSVLRNTGKVKYPMYAGICTVFFKGQKDAEFVITNTIKVPMSFMKKTFFIALPIIANEFLWSFGETIFGVIYGRMGTSETTAMTLTYPIQGITVGLFSGISAAAAIMVGTALGEDQEEKAYHVSKQFLKIGVVGTVCLGIALAYLSQFYVRMYKISEHEANMTIHLLCIFALFLCIKVSNMILSGGILKSGGKTKYVLYIDIMGTWLVGIPLGFLTAFQFHLPIEMVYFCITTEELVRLTLGICLFRKRIWMNNITKENNVVY